MNILFLANLVPYPLDNGGKMKTFTTIKALSENNEIDLLCFYEKESVIQAKEVLQQYCRNIVLLPIRVTTSENKIYMINNAIKCLFTKEPLNVFKYRKKQMMTEIESMMSENKYDVIYYNYLHMYLYSPFIKKKFPDARHILDTQNCETLILKRYAENSKNIIKKIYLSIETSKLSYFEKWAIQDADKVIFLSREDEKELQSMCCNKVNGTIIPIGLDTPVLTKKHREIINGESNILFIGTLTWAPNNEGIIWFLENVFERVIIDFPLIKLYIVGKNPSERLREIARKYKENIVVTGYVESVDEYYNICDFTIVPLFFGSGQRVKIIEAFSKGMPVISTKIGAEGLEYVDGESILIADDKEKFIECIRKLKDKDLREKMSKKSMQIFEKNYSIYAIERLLNQVICDTEDNR